MYILYPSRFEESPFKRKHMFLTIKSTQLRTRYEDKVLEMDNESNSNSSYVWRGRLMVTTIALALIS